MFKMIEIKDLIATLKDVNINLKCRQKLLIHLRRYLTNDLTYKKCGRYFHQKKT